MSAPAKTSPAGTARTGLDPVESAIEAMAAGRAVIVVDNEDRENEGDIIFAANTPRPPSWDGPSGIHPASSASLWTANVRTR